MLTKRIWLTLGLYTLTALAVANAQSTKIKLFGPNDWFTTANGTVTFPFGYYNIDSASGRKMYDDPIVKQYYDAIKQTAEDAGYTRSCLSRQIYLLKGPSVSTLKQQEATWVRMMQGKPIFYKLQDTVKYPSFKAQGETISGTAYVFNTDDGTKYGDGLTVYAFFVYPKTGISWVLECGSGK